MKIINRTILLGLGLALAACGGGEADDNNSDSGQGGEGNEPAGCVIVNKPDGNATITCGDDSVDVKVPEAVDPACVAEDNKNGTWTLTCGDSDPLVVEQVSNFGAKFVLAEGSDLFLASKVAGSDAITRQLINKPYVAGGALQSHKISSDNKHVAFLQADDTTGTVQLYVSDISGDKPTSPVRVNAGLFSTSGAVSDYQFSPDGSKIGYIATVEATTTDLFVVEVAKGKVSKNAKISNLTGANSVKNFVFSADGKKVAFLSNQETSVVGVNDLYVSVTSNAADPVLVNEVLTDLTSVQDGYGFNATGDRLAFRALLEAESYYQLYVSVIEGAAPAIPDVVNGSIEGNVQVDYAFSPDGKKIAFRVDPEDAFVTDSLFISDVTDDNPSTAAQVDSGNATSESVTRFAFTSSSKYLVYTGTLTDVSSLELYSSDVSKEDPGTQKKLNPDLATDGNVADFWVVPKSDDVAFTGDIRTDARTELFFTNASAANDAVVVNTALPTSGAVSSVTISKNGAALLFLAPSTGTASKPAAQLVGISKGKTSVPKVVSVVSDDGVANIVTMWVSNTGKLVALGDTYLGTYITDSSTHAVVGPVTTVEFLD